MAYATFTDALMQAKRAAQLRGTPFSTADTQNLQSSYMSGAAERAAGGRSAALAEQTLASQRQNFAGTLAQQKELSTASLLQGKTLSDATLAQTRKLAADKIAADKAIFNARVISDKGMQDRQIAADKIIADNKASADRQTLIDNLAYDKWKTGMTLGAARIEAEAQIAAQEAAAKKALIGNVLSTGATLGGAYLLAPGAGAGAAATGVGGAASLGTEAAISGTATGAGASSGLSGVAGTLGTVAGYAAPAIIAAHYGMPVLGDWLGAQSKEDYTNDPSSNFMTQAANITAYEWDRPVEAGVEALGLDIPDWAETVFNPGSALLDAIGCIIVTACTDRHSPEVEIAREYRDKFLDTDQLRGYYLIAEKVVPLIESNGTVKRMVKKWLVDRLVDYGAVALGKKPTRALRSSWIVSRMFLSLIRAVGKTREQFVRSNMEVY